MSRPADRVAILGVGQTGYAASRTDVRLEELIFEAASKALEDAKVDRRDIDNVVIAASDQLDGRAISSMMTAAPAGGYLKDELKVSDEGAHAAILASLRLFAGLAGLTLVVSWTKCSEAPIDLTMHLSAEPFFHRDAGINHVSSAALMVQNYWAAFDPPPDAAARVIVKNRSAGLRNPLADRRRPISVEDVMNSPFVAWPIRARELAKPSDGACALVLAAESHALTESPLAWLEGLGWAAGPFSCGERDLVSPVALRSAARQAYSMAGIHDPVSEIDVAEVHDVSGWHELTACEGLGLCEDGGAPTAFLGGANFTPPVVVNPSGGCTCTNPIFARGLVSLAEASLQVAGRAGDRQVRGARTAVVQASSGFAGQSHAVFVLRGG